MNARVLATACALALTASCSSTETPEREAPYAADCSGLDDAKTFDCAEQRFWQGFQQKALEPRKASESVLAYAISAFPNSADKIGLSRMHFRLGQIRLAMAVENDVRDYFIRSRTDMIGEFETAMRLDPSNGIIAPWKDTVEIAIPAVFNDWETALPLAERGFANVPLNPIGNTLSLSGTTIGFPLDTGVPQRTTALLDAWNCVGPEFCERNTSHSPWARAGLSFHFAEAYARVGDREKARAWLDRSLAAPGASEWPYRSVALAASDDLDGFLKKFSDRGQDRGVFDLSYANQNFGCLFCHEK